MATYEAFSTVQKAYKYIGAWKLSTADHIKLEQKSSQ